MSVREQLLALGIAELHEILLGMSQALLSLSPISPTSAHGAPRIPLWGRFPLLENIPGESEAFRNSLVILQRKEKYKPTYFRPTPVARTWNISLFKELVKEFVGTCRHPRAQSLVLIINPAKFKIKLSCPSLTC